MRTLGVDLSAESKRSFAAVIEWDGARAKLIGLEGDQSDEKIATAAAAAEVVGIDCPLGWPDAFVDFVATHRRADSFVGSQDRDARRRLVYRDTDRAVVSRLGTDIRPLSVATDKLGLVAVRCAGLLGTLAESGLHVDRTGMTGAVVEVYPAASLSAWGLPAKGYKRPENRGKLGELVKTFGDETSNWLDVSGFDELLSLSDDAFDALVAALTARAARTGLTGPAPSAEGGAQTAPAREGWIHVPIEGSLALLPHDPA